MASRRMAFVIGLVAAVAIGTALRLSTRDQLAAGARVRALSSDDDYHLRRARFALANYPKTIVFDPLMNFPSGGVAIWPPLYDLALATPTRLLHGAAAPPETLEREAAWVPVALAAGAILLAGFVGRELAGPAGGIVLALFLAVSPGHILWTQYGHTDQHVAESFFGLLVLWLFVRSRREKSSLSSEILTGAALALAVLAWQGAIYWGAIIALSLLIESILTRRSILRPVVLILGLAALLVAPATALWLGGAKTPFTYISFGLFQPAFLAALAGGTLLLETGLRAARRQLTRREIGQRGFALVIAVSAILPFAPELLLGLARGIGYVLGRTSEAAGATGYVSYPKNWLSGIFEARPLLADGPGLALRQLSAAFFLAPAVIVLWSVRAVRGLRPGHHIALAVWGAVTLFLALSQRLNVYYAAPLAGLCLIEATSLFAGLGRTFAARAALAGFCGLLLSLPMIPGVKEEVRAVRVPGSDLFDTLEWMRRELPHAISAYDGRLLNSPSSLPELSRAAAVLAPWSLGHLILYNAELPVVANNFGYGFEDSIRFFLAESEEEALAIARARRARWILATDLAPRLNQYAGYIGRAPYFTSDAGGLNPSPRYFSTLQSRLYDFDGRGSLIGGYKIEPLAHFHLLYHSRSAIRRGEAWLARWKVFEIVD